MHIKKMLCQDTAMSSEAERGALQAQAPREHRSASTEDANELAFSGEMHHFYPEDPFVANDAVSKWRLKGKRNTRHLTKKSIDRADGKILNGPLLGSYHGIRGSNIGPKAYGFDDADLGRKYIGTQMFGLDNGCNPYEPRFLSKGRIDAGHNLVDWREMIWEDRPVFRGRWEERASHFNPVIFGHHHFGGRLRSMLIDVDLKVQASYQKEPVPIVSLMSKLDGKAIIGHPIQIEALEEGLSETLISINDYHSIEAVDHDGNTPLQPAWRTARRTNLRVPRPHLSSVLSGEDPSEDPMFIDREKRFPFKKSNAGSYTQKTGIRKSHPHISRPLMDRKFVKKLPKKASLTSNQKTRTLSSIGVQQNFGVKPIHYPSVGVQMKPDTSGGPTTVACIPVKLVFSRLLEKINRPPSKEACKVIMSNREWERQPS